MKDWVEFGLWLLMIVAALVNFWSAWTAFRVRRQLRARVEELEASIERLRFWRRFFATTFPHVVEEEKPDERTTLH